MVMLVEPLFYSNTNFGSHTKTIDIELMRFDLFGWEVHICVCKISRHVCWCSQVSQKTVEVQQQAFQFLEEFQ